MTGYRSPMLKADCVHDGCLLLKGSDWQDIIDSLPGKIAPSDVDGMVEINGHFLVLEEKTQPDAVLSKGQARMLMRLSELPEFEIIVFRPHEASEWEYVHMGFGMPFLPITRAELRDWIRRWAENAVTNPMPRRAQ